MTRDGAGRWLPVVAFALWSSWVVSGPFTDLPPLHSWTSELGASDQRWGPLFRTCDALAGTLMLLWSVLLLHREGGRRDLRTVGLLAVALFGGATVADALVPLACASSVDAACLAAEEAGALPWTHDAHTLTSTTAGTGLMVAAAAFSAAALRDGRRRAGRVLLVLLALMVLTLVWQLVCLLPWTGQGTEPWVLTVPGLAQRLQLASTVVWWMVLVATGAHWRDGEATGAPARH